MEYDKVKVFDVLRMDKKKDADKMNFVLLDKIGRAVVHPIPLVELEKIFKQAPVPVNQRQMVGQKRWATIKTLIHDTSID